MSKSREDHIKFDMNYCQHYKPQPGSLKQDYCALGHGASERMKAGREAGEPKMTPCIGGHTAKDVLALCPHWIRRTRDHAENRADEMEAAMERMAIVMPVVNDWRKKPPFGKQEVIECPKCKGRLHLSQSSYNGHVHGQCETEGCVSWME